MATQLKLKLGKRIDVENADLKLLVKQDTKVLGLLTMSKGSIDWRRKHAKSSVTKFSWGDFATLMEATADKKVKAQMMKLARAGVHEEDL